MTKNDIQCEMPRGFVCTVSYSGLTIHIEKKCKSEDELHQVGKLVNKIASTHHLRIVNEGIWPQTMIREWDMLDKKLEKELVSDAKVIVKSLKAFFKKWNGNAYCESSAAIAQIEKIRAMVETDEN